MNKKKKEYNWAGLSQDNSILAQEILFVMDCCKSGKYSWARLKLDKEKAFDRLERPFILQFFQCLGSPTKWIPWIC